MPFPQGAAVLVASLLLTVQLGRIALIDARTLRIPDRLSLPLIALGLVWSTLPPHPDVLNHLIGAAVGYLVLALIGEVHFRRTGSEGLGLGDAKLFAGAGAWLGWQALPQVLLIAAVAGLTFAVAGRALGKPMATQIAFGPWLALGFWGVWIWQAIGPAA